jgi:hypothetical protein
MIVSTMVVDTIIEGSATSLSRTGHCAAPLRLRSVEERRIAGEAPEDGASVTMAALSSGASGEFPRSAGRHGMFTKTLLLPHQTFCR